MAKKHSRPPESRESRRGRREPAPTGARPGTPVTTPASNVPSPGASFVVAVLNSNQDVLRLIRSVLEDEGYTVATEHIMNFREGQANLTQFLLNHRPDLLVYDVAPPYKENWNFLQLLRKIPEVAAISMVLTTVNKKALENFVGKTNAFEILGTRDNLAPLIENINRSVRSRHTSDRAAPGQRTRLNNPG
jgi:CheY-like chemotaxis protein